MTEQIPQDFIDNVLRYTNIVEIVSDYVTLRQRGKDFKGLCPFHSEKTPSFSVNTEKQIFYCFGCHAGGNALTFLMKKENYPFLEALEILAERAGMSLPQRELSQSEREKEAQRQRWRDLHSHASEYFKERLQSPEGREALVYLRSRKIDDTELARFGLGYAPQGWTGLLTTMVKNGFTSGELEETGLVVSKKNDSPNASTSHYDRFRNRVIFTIRDVQGRVIAFGGRVLDNAVPKYLNSPETMFFSKGRCLYALDLAVPAIRAQGYALLMEGYMDVISAHRVGFTTAVATLGTALTREQAHMLKRYTSRVFICYDSDEAGIQAAKRAGEILMAEDIDSFVVNVNPAKDPDEFLLTASPQEFEARRQAAAPYLEYKFKTMLSPQSSQSAQDKSRLIQKAAPEILQIKSPIVRESIERFIAQELNVTYEAVRHELFQIESKRKKNKKYSISQEDFLPIQDISVRNRNTIEETPHAIGIPDALQRSAFVPPGIFAAEQLILRILLEDPSLKEEVTQKLGVDFWSLGEHGKIFQSITETAAVAAPHTLQASLAAETDYTSICESLAAVMELEYIKGRENEMLNDCLISILNVQNREAIEKMQNEAIHLYNNGDIEGSNDILQQIGERLRRG